MAINLSKNFTLEELTRSNTAQLLGIDNKPNVTIIGNLQKLAKYILQPTRDEWRKPLIITSGYRCLDLNKAVGGAQNSYHTQGLAADVSVMSKQEGRTLATYFLRRKLCDLVILENHKSTYWVHVQLSQNPRHRYLELSKS